MSEPTHKKTVMVGFFILIGLSALLAGIMVIGNLHSTFSKKVRVTAFFEDVNGLLPGSNVWFSGVKIGTVKKLRFHGKSQVEVLMNLNEEAKQYIRQDAKAKISTDGLIGNKIVVIYGGTTRNPEVQEGDTLHVDPYLTADEIMGTLQQNNKNILDITNNFKEISEKLNKGEGTVGKLITDKSIYTNIDETTQSLKQASINAQQLMASLSGFSEKLNKRGNLVNDLVTDTVMYKSMSASIKDLEKTADSASALVSNLKRASSNPNSTLGVLLHDDASGKNIKSTIKSLESSSKKLDRNLEALKYSFLLKRAFKKMEKAEKEEEKADGEAFKKE